VRKIEGNHGRSGRSFHLHTQHRPRPTQALTSTYHPPSTSSASARVCLPQHPVCSAHTLSSSPRPPYRPSPPSSPPTAGKPSLHRDTCVRPSPPRPSNSLTSQPPPLCHRHPRLCFRPAHSRSDTSADWHLTWLSTPRRPCPVPVGKTLLVNQIPWGLDERYPSRQKAWNTIRRWMRGQRGRHTWLVFEGSQASRACG
jgi:hypothetical protein